MSARPKFLAFVKNKESAKVVKEFAVSRGYPETCITEGSIVTAQEKLVNGNRAPEFLLVELSSKESKSAFTNLDKLANHCEPDTKVIVLGDIDELSFYKELINMGVSEYLLNPLKIHQLERVTTPKAVEEKKDDKPAVPKVDGMGITVIGTRGGVGASTIAINLAKVFAARSYPTVILDFDADFGVIPLLLDVEPNRGLIDALEKPERVDALFLDRAMTRVDDNLFIIGAEKNLTDTAKIDPKAAQVLFQHLKSKFAYVIVDIPHIDANTHHILQHSDNILVTELSIPGLRDTMRVHDLLKDTLGSHKITLVANKTGINKKFETPQKDFESGLGKKLDFTVPFEPEVYGYNNGGKTIVDELKDSKFAASIKDIAGKFAPDGISAGAVAKPKKASILDKLKAKK